MKELPHNMFRNDVILTAIRGCYVCEKLSDAFGCLNHMAGYSLFDIEAVLFMKSNQDRFRVLFPDLMEMDLSGINRETVHTWVEEHKEFLSQERQVPVLR